MTDKKKSFEETQENVSRGKTCTIERARRQEVRDAD